MAPISELTLKFSWGERRPPDSAAFPLTLPWAATLPPFSALIRVLPDSPAACYEMTFGDALCASWREAEHLGFRMTAKAIRGKLRTATTLSFFAALLSVPFTGAAIAQIAPPVGVQPGTPGVAMPQIPPPITPPTSSPGKPSGPSAPLATSPQDCQNSIGKLASRRLAVLQELNKIAKANKGKLDPVAACPKFRALVSIETQFRNFLVTNKDWCNVPSQVVDTVKQSTAKDMQTSARACQLAVQFKKAQQAAQSGLGGGPQPQRLPAGPL